MRMETMKTQALYAILCALLAAPAVHAQQTRDGTIARLVDMNGNVLVSRESGLASGNEALRLLPGTRVITTANSEVVVEYDDGCRVKLKENQRFEVERGKPCALLLAQNIVTTPSAGFLAPALVPALFGGASAGMLIDSRTRQSVSPS
jgi:hypothetical protein